MLISQGKLGRDSLKGEVAIVTGAGRGIGYETARALLWLGANVAVAEINENNGKIALRSLEKEFGKDKAIFVKTDVGNTADVEKLQREVVGKWGKVDIIINNATVYPVGSVQDLTEDNWDISCNVNLHGPILLAKAFLSDMTKRQHGVFVCVSSSGTIAYLGAHSALKAAQTELARTIAAEVEGTGVYAFAINPGIVKTPGFLESGGQAAALKGTTLEQILLQIKSSEVSPEMAGAGFAAAVALAQTFHGQEGTSAQALQAIGISVGATEAAKPLLQTAGAKKVNDLYFVVFETFSQQLKDWRKSNMLRKQYIMMDFKKNTEMTPEEMFATLQNLGERIDRGSSTKQFIESLKTLAGFYEHQLDTLKGFEKIQKKRQEGIDLIVQWKKDVEALIETLS